MSKSATWAVIVIAFTGSAVRAEPIAETRRPGLVATYHDASGRRVMRLEPTVALALNAGEASHPRLTADGGTVRWQGLLNIVRSGQYRFGATMCGRLRIRVGNVTVFEAEATADTPVTKHGAVITLAAGMQPFVVEFTRSPGVARAEVFWQPPGSLREPLSHDVCFHEAGAETDDLRLDMRRDHGRFLAEEHGCANCHTALEKPLAVRRGPDLSRIGERTYPGWVDRWLERPAALRPAATMPQLFADDEVGRAERFAVASYLGSLGGPVPVERAPKDTKELRKSLERGRSLFTTVGCVLCHPNKSAGKPSDDVVSIYGFPAAGTTSSYPLGSLGSKTTADRLASYLANPLAVNPHGRMPDMLLRGTEAADLPRFLCETVDRSIQHDLPPEPSADAFAAAWNRFNEKPAERTPGLWRSLGRSLVRTKGCLNCHDLKASDVAAASAVGGPIDPGVRDRGCLADVPTATAPRHELTAEERSALREFMAAPRPASPTPAPAFAARLALRRFNCLACHQRDGEGGLTPEQAEELRRFERVENAEAVTPPPLTGVGHKLLGPALRGVLVDRQRVRPWMGLRMPHYGPDNVGPLAAALPALEGTEPVPTPNPPALDLEKLDAGRRLAGKGGFGCISCHDFAGTPNGGTRGPDLTLAANRLRYDWFRRWLEQPQRMQPGTRMPQVFTDGKSTITEVCGGAADAQAAAMWSYCTNGKNLPPPDGLEPPGQALAVAVKDRPVLIRTFLPAVGTRALAIGYPGGVSVAFDPSTARVSYAWSGNFLDAAPAWTSRGGGTANPLGRRFWTAPAGTPWGLGSLPPDFAALEKERGSEARAAAVHFGGYEFAADGMPTFHYRVEAGPAAVIRVSERPEPLRHPAALGLARRFSVRVPAGLTGWFFAAETMKPPQFFDGERLNLQRAGAADLSAGDRLLVVDTPEGPLALSLGAGQSLAEWRLAPTARGWRVLVKVPGSAADNARRFVVRMWALPGIERDLLRTLQTAK